jgi:hypothetical protein
MPRGAKMNVAINRKFSPRPPPLAPTISCSDTARHDGNASPASVPPFSAAEQLIRLSSMPQSLLHRSPLARDAMRRAIRTKRNLLETK